MKHTYTVSDWEKRREARLRKLEKAKELEQQEQDDIFSMKYNLASPTKKKLMRAIKGSRKLSEF